MKTFHKFKAQDGRKLRVTKHSKDTYPRLEVFENNKWRFSRDIEFNGSIQDELFRQVGALEYGEIDPKDMDCRRGGLINLKGKKK